MTDDLQQAAPDAQWVGAAGGLAGYGVDGLTPRLVARPGTAEEVARVLQAAGEAGWAVAPRGGGTDLAVGNPRRALDLVLDLRAMDQVVEHDRANLTVTVGAGCTLAALGDAVAGAGQWLPLEAPAPERCTVGGVLAANRSGPRRLGYGTARDLVLGMEVALANGEVIRPGGRTVKNVAGYDLSRLFVGSWGTLGAITAATLRLFPQPEASETVLAAFDEVESAFAFAGALCDSRVFPAAVEVVDALPGLEAGRGQAAVAVLLEGDRRAVARQVVDAEGLAWREDAASVECLGAAEGGSLWQALARSGADQVSEEGVLLRLGLPPARLQVGWHLLEGLAAFRQARAGAGILWAALPQATVEEVAAWREEAQAMEGYLVLERGPLALRRQVDVWGPVGPQGRVMRALKEQFDPHHCLNPGLFVEGL